ncbi:hypothetical protein FKX85_15955 [Echinicola soli]|uniref:Uncharacterized protein n=1 Tax=Echinicola soli TaxID=2591634 RepID=A0A514CL90_9BACT|nr:hypothetical protein [Echinicola soli]QDH80454.1 hypothetical protein FKX85_15955 [Echinicola soli]
MKLPLDFICNRQVFQTVIANGEKRSEAISSKKMRLPRPPPTNTSLRSAWLQTSLPLAPDRPAWLQTSLPLAPDRPAWLQTSLPLASDKPAFGFRQACLWLQTSLPLASDKPAWLQTSLLGFRQACLWLQTVQTSSK